MSTDHKLKKEDLLLLFLYSEGTSKTVNEPITGRTRLVKLMFVFTKEYYQPFCKDKCLIEEVNLPDFFAWKYGPMSKDVLQDIEFFKKINFLKTEDIKEALAFEEAEELSSLTEENYLEDSEELEYVQERYSLTDTGIKFVEQKIMPLLGDQQRVLIKELKKRFNEAPLRKILQYVYRKYPKYREKSLIKEDILP